MPPESIDDIPHLKPYGSARFAPLDYAGDTGRPETGVYFGNLCTPAQKFHKDATAWRHAVTKVVPAQIGPRIYSDPEKNTLVCAPTGAGKGTAIIMPTLLQYTDSVFVIDPKGENCAVTMRRRKELGQTIHVLNPWNVFDLPNACINPLDSIHPDDRNAVSKASEIAHSLVVPAKGGSSFWDTSAHGLIRGMVLYVAAYEREKNLGRVRALLSQGAEDLRKTLDRMAASELYSGVLSEIGNQFSGMENRTFSDVLATALAHLDFLVDPVVRESLARSDVSFSDLLKTPTSVFVIIPLRSLAAQARWLRLAVGLALSEIETLPEGGFNNRCLFILDEFPALGYMDAVRRGVSTVRGYGADFCIVTQNFSQLTSIYGQEAATIASNCPFKWFSQIGDPATAEYLSEMLGRRTVSVDSTSFSSGPGGGGSSRTTSLTGVPLASPDELMRAAPYQAFLLQGVGDPILIHKAPFYNDETLRNLADPNPYYRPPARVEAAIEPGPKTAKRGLLGRLFRRGS